MREEKKEEKQPLIDEELRESLKPLLREYWRIQAANYRREHGLHQRPVGRPKGSKDSYKRTRRFWKKPKQSSGSDVK